MEWIDRNEGGTENFSGISYDDGLFLLGASGAGPRLFVSTDGIEWTPRESSSVPQSTGTIYFIEHQFITGNTQGKLVLSPDTEYWRADFLDITLRPGCFCVGDGKVVIGGGAPGLVMSGDLPPEYNLTVSSSGNGSVDVYPVLDTYPRGISVRLTPLPDLDYGFDGWSGDFGGNQDPFYATLWDGDRTVAANFVITATGYRRWLFDHFSNEERADDAISGFDVDTDRDGRINLLEYVGNTNPKATDAQPFYEYDLITEEGETYLLISYTAASELDELTTFVEFSDDLETWSANEEGVDPTVTELYDSLDNEDGTETLFHKLLAPLSDEERKFLRVRFVEE